MIRIVKRIAAAATGIALLGGAAYANIDATGGLGSYQSYLIAIAALGLGVGAVVIEDAWQHGRKPFAIAMLVMLLCGEAYALLTTAERVVTSRDMQQQPIRVATEMRTKAAQRVEEAEKQLAMIGNTPRLERALAAQREASEAVAEKAALRGCASNCRKLLEQQTAAAAEEVATARAEIGRKRTEAERELVDARAALAALPAPRSPDRLASILHWPAWSVDLVVAALASISINALGAMFLAYSAHTTPTPLAPRRPVGAVADWYRDQVQPSRGDVLPIMGAYTAYLSWCRERGLEEVTPHDFGPAMAGVVRQQGIAFRERDGTPELMDVAIQPRLRLVGSTAA